MNMNKEITDGVWRLSSDTVLADGRWQSAGASVYMVESESKLADIPDAVPGDMAYTAGYENVWQLGTDGTTWAAVSIDMQEGMGSVLALRRMGV